MPALALNYAALTEPVTDAEVKQYRAQAKAAGSPRYNDAAAVVGAVLVTLLFGGMIYGIVAYNTVPGIRMILTEGFSTYSILTLFTALFAVGLVFVATWIIRLVVRQGGTWENWLRLTRFAAANNLSFSPASPEPNYPGVIFTQGHSRTALNHLMAGTGRFFDIGNFQYVTGSGRNRRVHNWGFLALKLDRALPHMLLDAVGNNSLFGSNLPALYRREQVLSLEGDFDTFFTLYCPKEYERDALYVFTPDLMALLIDSAGSRPEAVFDVEIIDEWLFVYSSTPLQAKQVDRWRALFGVIDTVGAKTLSQTDRYADERVADRSANIVAPQGRRLRTRISVVAIIVVVLWAGLQIAQVVFD